MSSPTVTATSLTSSTIGPSPASRSAAFAVSVKLRNSASAVSAAEPMAKPLPIAAVVLPSESSASVSRRTSAGRPAISRDSAGVVGDRAVASTLTVIAVIGQHADRGQGDAVHPGAVVTRDGHAAEHVGGHDRNAITPTLGAVERMPIARPPRMTVAEPVFACSAMFCTGP